MVDTIEQNETNGNQAFFRESRIDRGQNMGKVHSDQERERQRMKSRETSKAVPKSARSQAAPPVLVGGVGTAFAFSRRHAELIERRRAGR